MGKLQNLPNIGKIIEEQLHAVGIDTADQLREAGSQQTWLKIQAIDSSACYNRLCGLEGAVQEIRWHNLSAEDKAKLKAFYSTHKLNRR